MGLDKALRRRAGADLIDLDTVTGRARFAYSASKNIDFSAIEKAVEGANYTLVQVLATLSGRATKAGDGAVTLTLDGTGQALRLKGDVPLDRPVRVRVRSAEREKGAPSLFSPGTAPELEVVGVVEP